MHSPKPESWTVRAPTLAKSKISVSVWGDRPSHWLRSDIEKKVYLCIFIFWCDMSRCKTCIDGRALTTPTHLKAIKILLRVLELYWTYTKSSAGSGGLQPAVLSSQPPVHRTFLNSGQANAGRQPLHARKTHRSQLCSELCREATCFHLLAADEDTQC